MKKLITGAVAAIALVLGFAACSGDLHENEVAPLYIEGVTSARVPMTKVNDTEQIYKFTYSKNLGGWNGNGASIAFKTMVDPDVWARDWGAPKDETITLKVGDTEFTALLNREADGVGGAGPGNILVYDLVEGQEYTIRMNVDMATLKGSIRIEGLSVAAPEMQIIVRTGINANIKSPVTTKIDMKRGGTTYTYDFIAAETVDLSYYFYCPALNTTYYVDGDKFVQVSDKLYDAHGNLLNTNGDTVVGDGYAVDGWKNASKISIVKNHKYSIKVEANDIPKGFNGKISYKEEEEEILKNAVLLGQWTYTDTHNGDYTIKTTDKFVANSSSVEFKVLRDSESNEMAFGAAVELKPGAAYEWGAEKEITYLTTQVVDDNKFSYKSAEKDTDALDKVKYIKITGLAKGKKYQFNFDTSDIENAKMKVSVAEYEEPDLTEKIRGCVFKGAFNGWTDTYPCKNFKDGTLEIIDLVNASGGEDFECGIFEDIDDSTYMYRGATIECKNEAGDYGDSVEFTEYGNGQGSNAHIKGLKPNAKFNIKITIEGGKVYVAVKVTEAGIEDTRTFATTVEEDYYIKGGITNDWWDFNVFATSKKTVVKNKDLKDKEIKEIYYGPFDKTRAGEFLLTNGGTYYKGITVKYLTGNDAYAQFVKGEGENDKVDLTVGFPSEKSNFYIVVKADSSNNKVWARIEPTNDPVDFQKQFLKGLTVSGWCRKWNDVGVASWVGTSEPGEIVLKEGKLVDGNYIWTADFKIPTSADVIDLSVHSSDWSTRYESTSKEKLVLDTAYVLKKDLEGKDPGTADENGQTVARGAFAVVGGKTYTVTYILEYNPDGAQTLKYKLSEKK